MTFNADKLQMALGAAPKCQHYLVALSGGVDSVVLLHALLQLSEKRLINPVSYTHLTLPTKRIV